MRRKDILIISTIVIVIAFSAVFGMYYVLNDGNIFSDAKEKVDEVIASKKTHHSNGWETAIVDKIIDDVPIPVGFTYVEGKEKTGLIIQNDITGMQYVWIPKGEISEQEYTEIKLEMQLNENTEETTESVEQYEGFYIAINSDESKTDINEIKEKISNMTYEKRRELELKNESKTNIAETHFITSDELASIIVWDSEITKRINANKLQVLTLGTSNELSDKEMTEITQTDKTEIEKEIDNIKEEEIPEEVKKNNLPEASDFEEKNDMINYVGYIVKYTKTKTEGINITNESIIEDIESNKRDYNTIKTVDARYAANIYNSVKNRYVRIYTYLEGILSTWIDGIPIPAGFTYVEGTEKTGFKITNRDNLRWIWIPAKDIIEELADKKMNEIADDGETTRYEIIAKEMQDGFIAAMESEIGDANTTGYKNYIDNAEDVEFKKLIDSIEKYGGFYISEAELGYDINGNSTNKWRGMYAKWDWTDAKVYVDNGDYYRNVAENNYCKEGTGARDKQVKFNEDNGLTYQKAVNKCKELYEDSTVVTSHLTYGLEYDAAVLYLINSGAITKDQAFANSTEIGKYQEKETELVKDNEKGINGIYGLAGNLSEITQEKDGDNIILRGGSWAEYGNKDTLASKSSQTEETIDVVYDENGNEKKQGRVGFRACLYINTTYNAGMEEKIQTVATEKIGELKDYIDGKSVKIEGYETNYFNKESNIVKSIVSYVETTVKNEKSTAAMGEIIQEGKDLIDTLVIWIDDLINDRTEKEDGKVYTYGEVSATCWSFKEDALSKIEGLKWVNGNLIDYSTNPEGEQTTYEEIVGKAKNDITWERNNYKDQVKAKIDEMNGDEAETEKIKEEITNTEDLAKVAQNLADGTYADRIGVDPTTEQPTEETTQEPTDPTTQETTEYSVWTGGVAEGFEGGDGTEGNPYQIATADQLAYLAKIVNEGDSCEGKYYIIKSNLNLDNKKWTPIGNGFNPFKGYLLGNVNGAECKIKGLNVNVESYAGLIGRLEGVTVKNIIIESGTVIANETWAGGIVGFISDGTVVKCTNNGAVRANETWAGGIVGSMWNGRVINCINEGAVTANGYAGGIVGSMAMSEVKGVEKGDCNNKGSVEAVSFVGGIVGRIEKKGTVINCTNEGALTANSYAGGIVGGMGDRYKDTYIENCTNEETGTVKADSYAGGIVGGIFDRGYVNTCTNNASVTANDDYAGGIVGKISDCGYVNTCTNNGAVRANDKYAGGIVGQIFDGGHVNTCTNKASVTADSYAGGIVGQMFYYGYVKNSINEEKGTVTANSYAGGIVGLIYDKHGEVDDASKNYGTVNLFRQ